MLCYAARIEIRHEEAQGGEEAQEGEPKEEMDVDKEDGGKGWNKKVVNVPVYSQHHVIFPIFAIPFPK